jgi:hypothetical protein
MAIIVEKVVHPKQRLFQSFIHGSLLNRNFLFSLHKREPHDRVPKLSFNDMSSCSAKIAFLDNFHIISSQAPRFYCKHYVYLDITRTKKLLKRADLRKMQKFKNKYLPYFCALRCPS